MHCAECKHWTIKTIRRYEDGSEIEIMAVPDGKGHCGILDALTTRDFGCIKQQTAWGWDHVLIDQIDGQPWQHWKMGPCPDCEGRGSGKAELGGGVCMRCVGTGNVRHYDDGHIGEERTRRHPKEPPAPPPGLPEGMRLAPIPPSDGALGSTAPAPRMILGDIGEQTQELELLRMLKEKYEGAGSIRP